MKKSNARWLVGDGEMEERIRAYDWSSHPFGPMDGWPDALRIVLSLALNSNMPTAIYWGRDLRLLYNDEWSGVPRDRHPKALGQKASEVWTDIWGVVGPQFDAVLNHAESVTSFDQLLEIERGGIAEETYWNYSLSPILGADGEVLGVFNQGHEVTDKVLAARERAAEIDRMRDLFAQAPGAIAVLKGPDHVFEIANSAYLDLIGQRDSVLGHAVSDVLPEVVSQGFVDLLGEVYRTAKPYVGSEVPIELMRDGQAETRVVDFVYQPTRDAAGQVDGIFVEAWDVTDRSQLLDELRHLTTTLEERVQREVAKKLEAEEKLNRVQRLEAIGQLTGGIAHDFNNMLAVIISALNILRRRLGSESADHVRLIEAAEDGAHRAAKLTQQLLAFARKQSLAPSRVNPGELVTSMEELIARAIGEQIIIDVETDPDVCDILADATQLENALLNLAINARDAMPEGGSLRLRVNKQAIGETRAAELEVEPGDFACISVEDTGTGMSPEIAGKVFDPFFTTKEVGKGTGLGLSQVIGFIQQSKGQIVLDTEEGRGTRFSLYLPRCKEGAVSAEAAVHVDGAQSGRGEYILVVEDDERLRGFTGEALNELGYSVETAPSGDEALNLIASGYKPDLVLTDIIMRGMTGHELARKLKALDAGSNVVFMSGYAHDATSAADIPSVEPLIKKPFTIETLASTISVALRRKGEHD